MTEGTLHTRLGPAGTAERPASGTLHDRSKTRPDGNRISPKHKQSTRMKCTLSLALTQHRLRLLAAMTRDYADATMLHLTLIIGILSREQCSPLLHRNIVDVKENINNLLWHSAALLSIDDVRSMRRYETG